MNGIGKSHSKSLLAILLSLLMVFSLVSLPTPSHADSSNAAPARQAEFLGRGLVAVLVDDGVFLSWRYLNTDPNEIAFNVYKNGYKVNAEPISTVTNYLDASGADSSQYQISTVINGKEEVQPQTVAVWHNEYLPIPLDKPMMAAIIPTLPAMLPWRTWMATASSKSSSSGTQATRRITLKPDIPVMSISMRLKWTEASSGVLTWASISAPGRTIRS
jgi:hypothetical protein